MRAMLEDLTAKMIRRTAAAVVRGPFSGMTITERVVWGNGDIISRLLGAYEMELWGSIEEVLAANPDAVINLGCAEGYYAVGLALRLPGAVVHAIDRNPEALVACEAAAKANRAEAKLRLEVGASLELVEPFLSRVARPFVLMDCEGAEIDIVPRLSGPIVEKSIFLVECHDFKDRKTTSTLAGRLSATHEIVIVEGQRRDPSHFAELSGVEPQLAAAALSENRPEPMHWIFARPRVRKT